MKNKKIVISGGLAFSEKEDLNKLSKYSKKGYHLKQHKGLYYILEKGNPTNFIYSIDYQNINGEELEEYLRIAQEAGWEFVLKIEDIIYLRAIENTPPLYTDKTTMINRDKNAVIQMKRSLLQMIKIIILLTLIRLWILPLVNNNILNEIFNLVIAGTIGFTIMLFVGMLLIATKTKQSIL